MKSTLPALLLLVACHHEVPPAPAPEVAPPAAPVISPVFTAPSTLPFGIPDFKAIKDEDFRPAFAAGIAEQRKEVDAITAQTAPATFDNTILALEKSGQLLGRVQRIFYNLNSSYTNDERQKIEEEEAPLLAAHSDAILLDPKLFARVDAVWQARAGLSLDPESAQLLARTHLSFLRAGAQLSDADKEKLKKLNTDISTLQTTFEQNTRKAMTDGGVVVDKLEELDGLTDADKSAAAEAAKAKGLEGKWVLSLQNTTVQPWLTQLTNRALRERIATASANRAPENLTVVSQLVTARAQKAALLGYSSYAAYALADETAGTPAAVDKILVDVGAAALVQAKKEQAEIQALIQKQAKATKTAAFTVQPWDWAFYAEQVRKERYAFDEAQVKPYFELDRVLQDGVFYSATALYGITFVERKDLPTYNPDVRVFEVHEADGAIIGLFLLDVFQADNKQGGAWMSDYVSQSKLFGATPVIVNNLNVSKPAAGQAVLLSYDDVTTLFHEFGHGLNGLLSNCTYPSLAGTATPPDFVEYPSQFNEMWAREPAVLAHYAKHYQTGEPMPKALFDKVIAAANFGGGYNTLEYIEAARLDMAFHEIGPDQVPAADQVMAFEQKALADSGLAFAPVPPRYHTAYFNHAFTGGYEAGYYAYIWSEVLARDSGAWFHAHGGMTRENGDRYRKLVLSRGRTVEPSVMFQEFYGAAPDAGPLLDYHGLKR